MVLMILLGLAAWIATCTIVEAEVFRDVRDAFDKLHEKYDNWLTYKLRYLVHCHMCTGIWVSAVIALFVPPIASAGFVGWGLTALSIKGIGHLFLVVHKLGEAYTDKAKANANWLDNDSILNAGLTHEDLAEINIEASIEGPTPEFLETMKKSAHVGWPK